MIHELLLSPTETASGSHPCCVVSVTYHRPSYFHGGNTGSNPVGDRNHAGIDERQPAHRSQIVAPRTPCKFITPRVVFFGTTSVQLSERKTAHCSLTDTR